jgi:N utilization substance protein B
MARRHAREAAVRWLYEHDLARSDPEGLMARAEQGLDAPSREFARALLTGVLQQRDSLDARLETLSTAWRVERMSAVDRAILRVGLYELLFEVETPAAVIINEAVELAGIYSSPDAKRFVNGVLSAAARQIRTDGQD